MNTRSKPSARWASCVATLALAACQATPDPNADRDAGYRVEVIRTDHGVVHITADDYASLGFGEGHAAAEDHLCNIARELLQTRGELAGELGPGANNSHAISDTVVRAMDVPTQARAAWNAQDPEIREWLEGYAAGYNRFVAKRGPSPTSWCAGAEWVRPATGLDFMARAVLLAQTLPRLAGAIAAAQPPSAAEPTAQAAPVAPALIAQSVDAVGLGGMGSNAWALGGERTENGRGLLLANPHYPWYGSNRFWEKHLTIPGRLDVYGVSLVGIPGVTIGFNRAVAWSHTVSDSERVVFYRLQLVPGNPTQYVYDGEVRDMRAETVRVPVRQEDGALEPVQRTVYFSHHGPVLTLPGMAWDERFAYTARDANASNHSITAQWKAMGETASLDEFINEHRRWNALPWVNTVAASADGRALYLDNTTVLDLDDEAIAQWRAQLERDPLAAGLLAQRGWILLDGSDSLYEPRVDNGAPLPGTVPFDQRPRLERRDYVFNSNNSYWLSNPEAPMRGFSPLYGPVDAPRSLRTRMNMRLLSPESPYASAGPDGRFSRRDIQQALFDNRSLAAELLVDPLVDACRAAPQVDTDGGKVDLAPACEALAGYDGHLDEDSRGAVLFREWITQYDYADTRRAGGLFTMPFEATSPVTTPAGLGDPALARRHLATALEILDAAGLPPDATLGEAQFAYRAGERFPVHGGNSYEGVANLQVSGIPTHPVAGVDARPIENSRFATTAGYPVVHGSSYILTLSYTDDGPVGEALMSYSQSGDPGSDHFTDQTRRYRAKQWRDVRFERDDIEANMQSRTVLEAPRGD